MAINYNINNNLFNSISELVKEPFLIIDPSGNVYSSNKEASDLFETELNGCNIFELFDESSSEKFLSSIDRALISKTSIKEQVNISYKNLHKKINYDLSLYKEGNENFLFCLIRHNVFSIPEINSLGMLLGDSIDKNLREIIEFINSEAPFTLTGLEKIRKFLNNKEVSAWIENIEGNFILITSKFGQQFHLKNSGVEGIPVSDFIMPVFHSMWKGINEVITKQGNAVKLNSVSFNSVLSNTGEECLKLPIQNNDKRAIAVLGIIRKKTDHVRQENSPENIEQVSDFLQFFPSPSFYLESDSIRNYNKAFTDKFLSTSVSVPSELKIGKIFSSGFIEIINKFLSDTEDIAELKITGDHIGDLSKNERFTVYLNRVIKNNQVKGVFVVLQEEIYADDLGIMIRKRGRMFDILLEKNPEPVFIYDTENLRFLDVNEPALKLYGYSKDEFLQMDLTDLYTPEDIQTLLDSTVSKEHFGKFLGPFRHRRKNGSSVLVEISKINFKFNGKDAHFNTVKNITETLELQKNNTIYKTAFENTQSLIFLTDSTGFITYCNKIAFEKLDSSKVKLLNSSFTSIVKDEDRGKVNTAIFQNNEPGPFHLNTYLKGDENNLIEVSLDATPIKDYKGNTESYIIVVNQETVTEIKEIVKEVIKEVPVSSLGTSQVAGSELDKNILSGIFHEILTPINVIIGFIQEFSDNSENLTEEQKEAIDIINQNRKTLLSSMNSIVEFIELEKTKYQLDISEFSVTDIVDSVQKELETSSRDGINLAYGKISSSLKFQSDRHKIVQLFTQLIKIVSQLNQNKKVYFSAYQHDEEKFIISVKDNYSSISPELFNSIRNIFENEQINKNYGLSKLSIKIIRTMLALLHGEFAILNSENNKPDYGFIFNLSFDVNEEKQESVSDSEQSIIPDVKFVPTRNVTGTAKYKTEEYPAKPSSEGFEEVPSSKVMSGKIDFDNSIEKEITNNQKEESSLEEDVRNYERSINVKNAKKINLSDFNCLYIEDQVDSQILFKVQMKELRDIKFAVSFEEALPLLDNYNFDFIVMDINLQGEYNGLDALKIIHKMPKFEKIPIIAVTAYVLPGDKEKFIATGFNDFISKPIFKDKMIDSLENIFLRGV